MLKKSKINPNPNQPAHLTKQIPRKITFQTNQTQLITFMWTAHEKSAFKLKLKLIQINPTKLLIENLWIKDITTE